MVNVFSFCLYGPYNPRYYPGLLENIFLAGKYFPTWKVYVYIGPDIDESMKYQLSVCSSVVLRETGIIGSENMIHRYFAIDEPDVELMFVRDADSRIHWKDRWAIQEFIKHSEFTAHTIRDNVEHTAPLMGGLTGLRKTFGIHIQQAYDNYKLNPDTKVGLGIDQNFLASVIYPKVISELLVHYSNNRIRKGEYGIPFPFEWINDIYCGRIETNYVEMNPPRQSIQLPQVFTRIR